MKIPRIVAALLLLVGNSVFAQQTANPKTILINNVEIFNAKDKKNKGHV